MLKNIKKHFKNLIPITLIALTIIIFILGLILLDFLINNI